MAGRVEEQQPAPRRGHGAQTVYDTLRAAILELSLAPGTPLDEVSLAARFGLSRTPVREAMVRLAAEGLVITLPNRSAIVSPFDFATIPAYFEALTLMLRVTTRLAALNRRADHLPVLRARQADYAAAVKRGDAPAMITANRDFHLAIAEAGGNPYFTQLFGRLMDEGRRLMRLYYQSFDDTLPFAYADEHRQMVDAIEACDAELADRLGAAHAAQIIARVQKTLRRDGLDTLDLSAGPG